MAQISGSITRKSNGSIEFTPSDPGAFGGMPAMGDEVTVDIAVTRSASEIARAPRVVPVDEVAPAAPAVVNRRR